MYGTAYKSAASKEISKWIKQEASRSGQPGLNNPQQVCVGVEALLSFRIINVSGTDVLLQRPVRDS
jgi:methyl coenzyme M reductase alpha subunit